MSKTRASTTEQARRYRQEGHDDATTFALMLGMDRDYQNDKKAKKDVIDPSGDAHSIKSGKKKWQIFLYGLSQFVWEIIFRHITQRPRWRGSLPIKKSYLNTRA